MTHAELLRKHATDATNEGGMWFSGEYLSRIAETAESLEDENAKLRELCADMYGFIKRMDEDCGDVTFSDCFNYCKHDTTDDGCCKTGECWYEQCMRELGVEVDA